MRRPKQPEFTADEFIAWALEQPTGRYELHDGAVIAMAPERAGHALAKLNAASALRNEIAARGLSCQAFPDGMSIRTSDQAVYEPDALVRYGPPVPLDATEIADPVIVVEVVSPSSRGIDRGVKLVGYFSLPSMRHYLIVDIEARVVIHHSRGEAGAIGAQILREGVITLDPPGVTIAVADIFAGL